MGYAWIALRMAVMPACSCSTSGDLACQLSYTLRIAVALTLQVAEMHPAAPCLRPSSRNTSEPGNTSSCGYSARIAAVLLQSPEESLRPTTVLGNSLNNRPMSGRSEERRVGKGGR